MHDTLRELLDGADDYEKLPLPIRNAFSRREYECTPDAVKQKLIHECCTPETAED